MTSWQSCSETLTAQPRSAAQPIDENRVRRLRRQVDTSGANLAARPSFEVEMSIDDEMSRTGISTPPDAVEAIARRVVDLLDSPAVGERYLDTPAVARMLGVSEEWVRDHSGELGAIRLGDGPRGALRFELERIRRALDRRRLAAPRQERPRHRPARRLAGVHLLPLPDSPGAAQ